MSTEEAKAAIAVVQKNADIVCAALVFFMQAGFAMVETGFTRAKNALQHHDEEHSTTTATGAVARIAMNTRLAGCAGAMSCMIGAWMTMGPNAPRGTWTVSRGGTDESVLESTPIDFVLLHPVIEYPFRGPDESGRLRPVAARAFQRILKLVLLEGRD